jgi:indole-3-glycerol phosphate synthase
MILDELAAAAKTRVAARKKETPFAEMRARAEAAPSPGYSFETALARPGMSFICEVKRASPSKGVIAVDFPYLEIAKEYAAAGADALSVLTEPTRFLGSDDYLKNIAAAAPLPVLRKDFTVDIYQIYEAKVLGASAVLIILAISDAAAVAEFIGAARSLGMSAALETRDEREAETALRIGAKIIGVNNRDLRDFSVDLATAERVGRLIPDDVIFVAESGIASRADVERMENAGADAVLIGETLMRARDKIAALRELRGRQT